MSSTRILFASLLSPSPVTSSCCARLLPNAAAACTRRTFCFSSTAVLVSGTRFASSTGKKSTSKAASSSKKKKETPPPQEKKAAAAAAPAAAAPSQESSSSSSLSASQEGKGSVKSDDQNNDVSSELEVEAVRWEVPEVTDRTVDDKGQYIVTKTPWKKTGEMAYTTPDAPGPLEARFGYQIVVVKRPQTYWQWYRTQINMFSFSHLFYQVGFALAVAWLITWVQLEVEFVYSEMRRPGNMAGDVMGKGDPNRHQKKITVSAEERDEVLQAMQMAFMDGKDMASRATKDYKMKKIPRPKDLKAEDFMRGG